VVKVRRDQKPGDYKNPDWYKHPAGTVAYEFTGSLPPAPIAATAGTGSMPARMTPKRDIEVKVRKPSSGHSKH
jgi:hypothetical protein